MTSKVTEAPYDEHGNLLGYPTSRHVMRPIVPFITTMMLDKMERGRSAARFIWIDAEGHTYPMFMRDMLDLAKGSTIINGQSTGTWIVRKSGSNYGIARADVLVTRPPRQAVTWKGKDTCRKCGRYGVPRIPHDRDAAAERECLSTGREWKIRS